MLTLRCESGLQMRGELEERVARQFSSLYLTLVSVLVGLVLSDLFSTIHDRMTLMPLTLETARTWCQILGNSLSVLSSWVTYSHLGLLRNRVPTIWDTVDVMLVLVTVPLNAATGLHDGAAWFFWAAAFLVLGLTAVRINLWQGAREPELAHLQRLIRFGGPYTFLYFGVPGYLAMALASHLHLTPLWLEVAAAATAPAASVMVTILFMREWRALVLAAPAT
jgi:hypothetical protein